MTAYYNEIDPYAAQWLRNLIAAGHIAHGIVDERSIEDVQPRDLHGFTQCHFFAGIGGWSLALRMAGWDDSRPVWTGSCPCQPFSVAGRGEGTADERHLWPVWFNLIRECQPKTVFGEQVEAAIRHGWLDLVQADMEGIGYAVAAAGIPACGVGAPHIRQRLWFVANNNNKGLEGRQLLQERIDQFSVGESGVADRVGDTEQSRRTRNPWRRSSDLATNPDAWVACADGKHRPIEPGTLPLAHGISNRVGRIRAYGNAIVPQVAQVFIESVMETQND